MCLRLHEASVPATELRAAAQLWKLALAVLLPPLRFQPQIFLGALGR